MVESTNEEDWTLVLISLENSKWLESLGYITYLYKIFRGSHDLWKENAPKLTKQLNEWGLRNKFSTFQDCMSVTTKQQAPIEQVEFLFEKYANHLKLSLENTGYNNIKAVTLKIELDE